MANLDAAGLGKFLLVAAGAHLFRTAPVNDIDVLRTEALGLYRDVDCRHAAADYHDAIANGQVSLVFCLA